MIYNHPDLWPRKQAEPYFTVQSPNPFTVEVKKGIAWDGVIEYSLNGITWTEWDASEIAASYILFFRGTGNTSFTRDSNNTLANWTFSGSNIQCGGNIMALLDYNLVAIGKQPTMGANCFERMFYNCEGLTKAPELPAMTLSDNCYDAMFYGCTGLTKAPKLPAMTLKYCCYSNMFYGCSGLAKAPKLPAMTIAEYCYNYMFAYCTGLTESPELPAMTLERACYFNMFRGCTGLTAPPELPATGLAAACYFKMFGNCTNIKLSSIQTEEYRTPYRIPSAGTGVITVSSSTSGMFADTGGTFTGTPEINTTYYMA